MNNMINRGVANTGSGNMSITGPIAVGEQASVIIGSAQRRGTRSASGARRIAVVTIKATEAQAVVEVFGLDKDQENPGFYAGSAQASEGHVELVVARALEPGPRSIMRTLENLCQYGDPSVLVLVGVGGGIQPSVAIGDVVIGTRVIYYDLRRMTPDGVRHRGEERQASAAVTHAVNSFFTDCGEPAELRPGDARFRVFPGLIGSGEAVITDAEAEIRRYLLAYNEKTLVVDMEAGGLTQFCYETNRPHWIVVRGVSDLADHTKSYDHQHRAAGNAAHALSNLIPYL